MTDDFDFVSNVKALADNGTLAELLKRMKEDVFHQWTIALNTQAREQCWHDLFAIGRLESKIQSFNDEPKVREWMNQRAARRI